MTAKTVITEYPHYFRVTGSMQLDECDLVTENPEGSIRRLRESAIHTQDWKELIKNKSAVIRATIGVAMKTIYEVFFCLSHGILGKLAVLSVLAFVSEEATSVWKKFEPLFEWGLPVALVVSAVITIKRTKTIASAVANIDEKKIELKPTHESSCDHKHDGTLSEWRQAFKGRSSILYKPPIERRLICHKTREL